MKRRIICFLSSVLVALLFVSYQYVYPLILLHNSLQTMKHWDGITIQGNVGIGAENYSTEVEVKATLTKTTGEIFLHKDLFIFPIDIQIYLQKKRNQWLSSISLDNGNSWKQYEHSSTSYFSKENRMFDVQYVSNVGSKKKIKLFLPKENWQSLFSSYGLEMQEDCVILLELEKGVTSHMQMLKGSWMIPTLELYLDSVDVSISQYQYEIAHFLTNFDSEERFLLAPFHA